MSKGSSLCVEGTPQDALGRILSDEPEIMGVLGPPSSDPARGDQTLTCVPAALSCRSLLLMQSHPVALSAAPMWVFFNDFFLCRPRDAERRVCFAASKASTPHFDAFQPLPRHCSCGTGCLIMSTCPCWDIGEHDASLKDVDVAWAGDSSRLSLLLAPSLTLRRVGWLEASLQPWWSWRSFCRASASWFCCWYWC